MLSSKRILGWLVWAAFVFAGSVVSAHDLPVERSVIAQVHSDRVEILLIYQESPGPRTDSLLGLYDINRDGKIKGKEVALATPEITKRALLGLQFEVLGERPGMMPPEVKFQTKPGSGISAVLLLNFKLDTLAADASRTLVIRVDKAHGVTPLTVLVEAAPPLIISNVVGGTHNGKESKTQKLTAGAELRVTARAGKSPNATEIEK